MTPITDEELRCYLHDLPTLRGESGRKIHDILRIACNARVLRGWAAHHLYLSGDEEDITTETVLIVVRSCTDRCFVPAGPGMLIAYAQKVAARIAQRLYEQRESAQRANLGAHRADDAAAEDPKDTIAHACDEMAVERCFAAIDDAHRRDPVVRMSLNLLSELVACGGYAELSRDRCANRGTLHAQASSARRQLVRWYLSSGAVPPRAAGEPPDLTPLRRWIEARACALKSAR